MDAKFFIQLCGDLDYEEMVADVYYENHAVGMITQEKGVEDMEVKLFQLTVPNLNMPLDDYIEALLEAKKRLIINRQMIDEE